MKNYLKLLETLLIYGDNRGDRTGTGTKSLFGEQLRFDLNAGFPLITTKAINLTKIIHELLWVLKGDSNLIYLHDNDVHIWDEWATENGDLGPIYPVLWTNWGFNQLPVKQVKSLLTNHFESVDDLAHSISDLINIQTTNGINQIEELITGLKERPFSRRHIITSWSPYDLPDESISPQENVKNGKMCLASCQSLIQFYVSSDNKLSCQVYQRSSDSYKGLPWNTAYYALFTMMVAQQCNMGLGTLVYTFGDVHLYGNHVSQATTQLGREPRELPRLNILRKPDSIFDYQIDDFELVGYDPYPYIKSPIAV